ncbi:MAG: FkbM family methyltransferase [Planctomycetes bacterium]|nr:FkbM family methyltransferase [Planctomycetota bacterium]
MIGFASCGLIDLLCWLTRTFQGFPGRWRLLRWLSGHQALLGKCRGRVVRSSEGFDLFVDPSDGIQRSIFRYACYDPAAGSIFHAICRPGDCVVDVGANIGYFTLLAARLVGPTGRVHAFEASPSIAQRLRRNVAINDAPQVTLHEMAISDRHASATFHTARRDGGYSSLRDLGSRSVETTVVPCAPLDSFIEVLPTVRLIKLDVEGAELLALKGMTKLIMRDCPYFIMELTDRYLRQLGGNSAELCRFMTALGYSLYRMGDEAITEITVPPTDQCDALCVHASQTWPTDLPQPS